MNSNPFTKYIAERYPQIPASLAIQAYLTELEKGEINYLPDQDGFAIYALDGDAVILYDIYTEPTSRRNGASARIADKIVKIGEHAGKRVIIGFSEKGGGGDREPGRRACLSYGLKQAFETSTNEVFVKGI